MAAKPYKPSCPTSLAGNDALRAIWRRTVTQLVADGTELRKGDVPAITRYVRALWVAEMAWIQVERDYENKGTLKGKGSMGQDVAEPLIGQALAADKHAETFAKALGLEPAARVAKNKGGRPSTRKAPRTAEPPLVAPLRAVP